MLLEKAKKWLLKTGACIIQVTLLFLQRDMKNWPFRTGDCSMQVAFITGLTVFLFQLFEMLMEKENYQTK